MAEAKNILRSGFSVVLLVATGLGLYNVFSDNAEVKNHAESVACGKPGCSLKLTREARNPIAQSFEYQLQKSSTPATVDCKLSLLLVGEWKCELTGGPSPPPSASPSGSAKPPR